MTVRRLAVLVPVLAALLGALEVSPAAGQGLSSKGSPGPTAREVDTARASIAARKEWLRSPQAIKEREASRGAFAGLGPERAERAIQEKHPELLTSRLWKPLGLVGDAAVEYVSETVARIEYADGSVGTAISQVPLRAKSRDTGLLGPVDLALRAEGGGFRARNPLVDVAAPGDAAGALRIGDRIALEIDGAEASAGVLREGRLLYPNALKDSDLIVRPEPSGAETFFVVRSDAAPRSYTLRPSSGSGVAVAANEDSRDPAAARLVADGETLATIDYPTAVDAQGQSVPVEMAVTGNAMRISLPDNLNGFAFPIALDPTVHQLLYGWRDGGATSFAGWAAYQSNPGSRWCTWMGAPYFYNGNGYYTYDRTGYTDPCSATSFSAYEVYEYNYYGAGPWAERTGISTYAAEHTEFFDPGPGGLCRYSGIYSADLGRWEHGTFSGNQCDYAWGAFRWICANSNCGAATSTPRNYLVSGTLMVSPGNRDYFTHHRSGAAIYVSDIDRPEVPTRLDSTWRRTGSYEIIGIDKGLGTQSVRVTHSSGSYVGERTSSCGVAPVNGCAIALPLTISVASFTSDGSFPLTATATDAGATTSPATSIGNAKIDRARPTLGTPEGTLYNARNQPTDHRREGLYDAAYAVNVDASDGGTSTKAVSGVAKVTLQILDAGRVVRHTLTDDNEDCTVTDCPNLFPAKFPTVDITSLPDGDYTVRLVATDKVDYPSYATEWPVTIDRRGTVYAAERWDGDPADAASSRDANLWSVPSNGISRLEQLNVYATRGQVSCGHNTTGVCAESRTVIDHDGSGGKGPSYRRLQSTQPKDRRIDDKFLLPHGGAETDQVTGQLVDAVPPFVTLPPAHGLTYRRYRTTQQEVIDDQEVDVVDDVYVDDRTKLPGSDRAS